MVSLCDARASATHARSSQLCIGSHTTQDSSVVESQPVMSLNIMSDNSLDASSSLDSFSSSLPSASSSGPLATRDAAPKLQEGASGSDYPVWKPAIESYMMRAGVQDADYKTPIPNWS